MKAIFSAETVTFSLIDQLPGAWTDQDYRDLLEDLDLSGIADIPAGELKEMCLMALTDQEPEDAAKVVLAHVFGKRLTSGQIDNISVEMLEEKMWEEYAEISFHEEFFNASQLLHDAFPSRFPHPEAITLEVRVTSKSPDHFSIFKENTEASLIRLLVQGMPESTLIHRLFDDKLEEGTFPEASDIIWQFTKRPEDDGKALVFEMISSLYWFHDFEFVESFEGGLVIEE